MRYNISRIFGVLVGIPVAFIVWLITVFALDLSFIIDMLISFGSFIASYFPTQRLTHHAHTKIRNILKSFINIRSIKDFRQVNDIYRISRSIHTSIKQRPAMFFKVESFFYSHLDNALNLVDSYTRLARMPRKSQDEKLKLEQTRITLDEIKRTLIADLKRLNEEDYERLDVEIELNKLEQQRRHNN